MMAEMGTGCISKMQEPVFIILKTQRVKIHLHPYPGVLFNEDGSALMVGESGHATSLVRPITRSSDHPIVANEHHS